MSVSMDYTQVEKMRQFLGFVEVLSQPEKLQEMRNVCDELAKRQGVVDTMDDAEKYHDKLVKEAEGILAQAREVKAGIEAQLAEVDAKRAKASKELTERTNKLDVYASTVNRQEVELLEKNKALGEKASRLETREAQIQAREAELAAKEQEYVERAERLRAAVGI